MASPSGASQAHTPQEEDIWRLLSQVPDPEIPVINVVDLGIVRYVRLEDSLLQVGVSPTYTACPATEMIHASIRDALIEAGYPNVSVVSVLFPPWSSDWLTDEARRKLAEYGIAPPAHAVSNPRQLYKDPTVECPRCAAVRTQRVSEFGSTPCKALYRCLDCLEPFEYFKCI